MPELMLEKSVLGKLPHEQERRLAGEIMLHIGEVGINTITLPFINFDVEGTKFHMREAKRKLEELGM